MAIISATELASSHSVADYTSMLVFTRVLHGVRDDVIFVDGASPLSVTGVSTYNVPQNTAVSVGQRYMNVGSTACKGRFFEVIGAGTTGTGDISPTSTMFEITHGTAKFASRTFSGWNFAAKGVYISIGSPTYYPYILLCKSGPSLASAPSDFATAYYNSVAVAVNATEVPTTVTTPIGISTAGYSTVKALVSGTASGYSKHYDAQGSSASTPSYTGGHYIGGTLACSYVGSFAMLATGAFDGCAYTLTTTPQKILHTGTFPTIILGGSFSAPLTDYSTDDGTAIDDVAGVNLSAESVSGTPFSASSSYLSLRGFSVGGSGAYNTHRAGGRYVNSPGLRTTTFSVYRTGGATLGGIPMSYEGRVPLGAPITVDTLVFYNTNVDSGFTISIELLIGDLTGFGISDLCTEDVWLEAVYLRNATTKSGELALGFDKYDRKGLIAGGPPPTMLAASASSWVGAPVGATAKTLSVTVNPLVQGPIKVFVKAWKCPWTRDGSVAGTIPIWVDPKITLAEA